jgi:hypothetical protein
MNTTLNDRNWQGFKPTMYRLDWNRLRDLPLVEGADIKEQGTATTVGHVLMEVLPHQFTPVSPETGARGQAPAALPFRVDPDTFAPAVTSCEGKRHVFSSLKNKSFNTRLLFVLLELESDGVSWADTMWFWFDEDDVGKDEPHSVYTFFVAHGRTIVREAVSFSRMLGNGFEPSVFADVFDSPDRGIWAGPRDEAVVRHWYRKFYQETETGQLHRLRNDSPPLFHYPEGRWEEERHEFTQKLAAHFGELRLLLWAIAVLLGIITLRFLFPK